MEKHTMRLWFLKMVREEMLEAGLPVNDVSLRTFLETMRDHTSWNTPFRKELLAIVRSEIFYLYGGRRKKQRR